MTVLIKCTPASRDGDGQYLVSGAPYEKASPVAGDTAYIWFSENEGGAGLAAKGIVIAVSDGSPLTLAVRPDSRLKKGLRKSDLAPYRDVVTEAPIAGLARKLYKHSLNKIAELTADEDAYLALRFESEVVSASTGLVTLEDMVKLEHLEGDGRKMFNDTAIYRLTTLEENLTADEERKPNTLRGLAADFVKSHGGRVVGRDLHFHMLKNKAVGKWDFGYIHSPRARARDWIREK